MPAWAPSHQSPFLASDRQRSFKSDPITPLQAAGADATTPGTRTHSRETLAAPHRPLSTLNNQAPRAARQSNPLSINLVGARSQPADPTCKNGRGGAKGAAKQHRTNTYFPPPAVCIAAGKVQPARRFDTMLMAVSTADGWQYLGKAPAKLLNKDFSVGSASGTSTCQVQTISTISACSWISFSVSTVSAHALPANLRDGRSRRGRMGALAPLVISHLKLQGRTLVGWSRQLLRIDSIIEGLGGGAVCVVARSSCSGQVNAQNPPFR